MQGSQEKEAATSKLLERALLAVEKEKPGCMQDALCSLAEGPEVKKRSEQLALFQTQTDPETLPRFVTLHGPFIQHRL